MTDKDPQERVDVNFESHPPIEDDSDGIAALLRQTLLQFVDCHSLAKYLIKQKDITQVIAQEEPEEEDSSDDEPDNDIYGVCSIVELPVSEKKTDSEFIECRKQLLKFIKDKCPTFCDLIKGSKEEDVIKVGLIVNERYINMPFQISLPTLKTLTQSLSDANFTHLVFISKILMKSRDADTRLQSKKSKSRQSSSDAEPFIFVNPEEEIISEEAEYFNDIDVSAHCDENASWSFGSDIKYIPHRRFMVVREKNWPSILKKLEQELNQ